MNEDELRNEIESLADENTAMRAEIDQLAKQRDAMLAALKALDAVIDLGEPWKPTDLIEDVTAINAVMMQLRAAIVLAEGQP